MEYFDFRRVPAQYLCLGVDFAVLQFEQIPIAALVEVVVESLIRLSLRHSNCRLSQIATLHEFVGLKCSFRSLKKS